MPRRKTALILGAGASFGYGFPLGSTLRQQIVSLTAEQSDLLMFGASSIRHFVEAFHQSQDYSIDAFLGRRAREFGEIGKAAIALRLLQAEQRANLFYEGHSDHWYQYLLQAISSEDWESFDPSWLSIVTFNYDRSLEVYLRGALAAKFGLGQDEVAEKLKSLEIVHVYGTLGKPWATGVAGDVVVPFGSHRDGVLGDHVAAATSGLLVIPEGRNAVTFDRARDLIFEADLCCLLGFGFDKVNLERLGAPRVFIRSPGRHKRIAATCMGLSEAQKARAAQRLISDDPPQHFLPVNCITLLQESLILDEDD